MPPEMVRVDLPNRFVDMFEARLEFAEAPICETHILIGVHVARIQLERASVLGDRFVESKLGLEYTSFDKVSVGVVWIDGKRF